MRRLVLVSGVVLCSLTSSSVLIGQSTPPLTPFRGLIDHASRTLSGAVPTGSVEGTGHALSADGRYVTFGTGASDLVPDDSNWSYDIFLRDRTTGIANRVSVPDGGGESNGNSWMPAISTNGRHVVFSSSATNLVAGDTNGWADVFVRDVDANRTVRVSVTSAGTQGDGDAAWPSISADGRFVAYVSNATTYAPGTPQYGPEQIYLHDRDSDADGIFDEAGATSTSRVTIGIGGGPANQGSTRPRVSADGRYVMFESDATNLDPSGDSNSQHHLYVYDGLIGQTTLIDRAETGGPSPSGVSWGGSDMSDDGRFMTFTSMSGDIAPSDANGQMQVFRYDAAADPALRTTVVSRGPGGMLGNGWSFTTSVSGDGRYVGFMTSATNLAVPAPSGGYAVVVADTLDGSFTRADVVDGGIGFDGQYLFNPSLSADGTAIAFQSDASNAVNGAYTNYSWHMFVVTAFSAGVPPVSPQEGGAGSIEVNTTAVSGWDASVPSFDDWITLTDGADYSAGPRTVHYLVSANPGGVVRTGRIRVGSTWITIRQEGDGDTTPPVITPVVTGTQTPDGWFNTDVTVGWTVGDPDSPIVNQSWACGTSVTIATDAIYAPITCEATSHGGTNSVTFVVRRDTTAPTISITQPAPTIYQGVALMPSFSCSEPPDYAGVATCVGSTPASGWLDTTPGRHLFEVTATDRAGNSSTRSVEYVVESGACVSPSAAPAHLLRWWKLDGHLRDSVTGRDAIWGINPGSFQAAVARLGWDNTYSGNALWDWDRPMATLAGEGLTVAAWVLPRGNSSSQTIVSNTLQYRIDRDEDGTLRWALKTPAGFDWVDTGVPLPASVWSHVAVTYADGVVHSYVNGRLVHSAQLGTLTTTGEEPYGALTLGGHYDQATLNGRLDDVMIFDAALASAEIDSLAMAGSGSLCVPLTTSTLAVSVPPTIGYGSTVQVSAQLTAGGRPVVNRSVTFTSPVSPGNVASGVTDATGSVTATITVDLSTAMGDVPDGIVASFAGDDMFGAAQARAATAIVPGTPPLELASHLSISYGTPVDQLFVAFSTVPGTFSFSPAAGTILDVGTYPLSVTLTPDDLTHWTPRTLTRPMVVSKAWPTVEFPTAPVLYNGQPQQANVTVRGAAGADLSPVTVLYNGGATLPVNAGTYALTVNYPGSANYNAVSLTYGSLIINKATPTMSAFGDTTQTYDGQPHAISANVTGAAGESLTPVVVTYNGSAAVPVNAGVYTIQARYDGSANYNAVSRTETLTIRKAAPAITWPNPASIVFGTALGAAQLNATTSVNGTFTYSPASGTVLNAGLRTLSVTFAPADASNYNTATASVTLNVAKAAPQIVWPFFTAIAYGTALGPEQLNAGSPLNGTFAYSPAAGTVLNAGSHSLTMTFTPSDSANYTAVTETRPVNVSPVLLVIRANDVAKPVGAPLPALSVTTTGFVIGESIASLSGSLNLSTTATASSPVGSYVITPSGLNSSNYGIGFQNGTLTVTPAATVTSVAASPNPVGLSQPVTLTASIAVVAPGAGTPGGSVQFFDGGTLLGIVPVAGGTASLTTNGMTAGAHTILAAYTGDAGFVPGSGSSALTVKTAATSSTTAVTSSQNPSTAGDPLTLTATVTAPSGLSGSVAFYDGATLVGTATVSGATARLFNVMLATGGHAITARYLGNSTIPPSASPALAHFVRPSGANTRTSTVSLFASPSPAALGSTVTLQAQVAGSQNKAPTGVVLFMVNGYVLAQGTLTQTGNITAVATLPVNTLPRGTHRVEAVYLGDAIFRASKTLISLVVN